VGGCSSDAPTDCGQSTRSSWLRAGRVGERARSGRRRARRRRSGRCRARPAPTGRAPASRPGSHRPGHQAAAAEQGSGGRPAEPAAQLGLVDDRCAHVAVPVQRMSTLECRGQSSTSRHTALNQKRPTDPGFIKCSSSSPAWARRHPAVSACCCSPNPVSAATPGGGPADEATPRHSARLQWADLRL
jgi:hypothetical protein